MSSHSIDPDDSFDLDQAESVTLTHDGPNAADVEITGDGTHVNLRIESGASRMERLFRNPVTITNKSKYVVTATW